MNTSESINELSAALSKAQGEIVGALKDSNNPFFKSKYADLASCWEACRYQLSRNGLAVIQSPEHCELGLRVTTRLLHSSGQWVESCLVVHPKDDSPQAYGSAITYARRYALAAIVGLAQVDDDGEAAMGRNGNGKHLPNDDPTPSVSDAQAKKVAQEMLDVLALDVGEDFKAMKVADMHDAINSVGGEPLYRAAWKVLASKPKERAQWKALHDLAKDKERSEHLNGHY